MVASPIIELNILASDYAFEPYRAECMIWLILLSCDMPLSLFRTAVELSKFWHKARLNIMLLSLGYLVFRYFKSYFYSLTPPRSAISLPPLCQDNIPDLFRVKPLNSLDLYEVTLDNLQTFLSTGRLTSLEYVEFCLERIRLVCNPFSR